MTAASRLTPRRLLVTGGAGFLGSHLAEALLARGDAVTVLDDLSTGSARNLADLRERPGFRFARGDVRDAVQVRAALDDCDAVIHLAAVVGVQRVLADPVRTLEVNLHGTELVLREAAERGLRVLAASSSEVYGRCEQPLQREDDAPHLGPALTGRWTYAWSKAAGEAWARAWHARQGLAVTSLRFFNLVGPRQSGRYGMVVPRFAAAALRGQPIPVYGDGSQSRSFTHVADAVEATLRLLDCPAAHGLAVNVGGSEQTTILQLAERVRTLAGSDSPIAFVPYAQAYPQGFEEVPRRAPCLRRLQALTGFRPRRDLDAMLGAVLAATGAAV